MSIDSPTLHCYGFSPRTWATIAGARWAASFTGPDDDGLPSGTASEDFIRFEIPPKILAETFDGWEMSDDIRDTLLREIRRGISLVFQLRHEGIPIGDI